MQCILSISFDGFKPFTQLCYKGIKKGRKRHSVAFLKHGCSSALAAAFCFHRFGRRRLLPKLSGSLNMPLAEGPELDGFMYRLLVLGCPKVRALLLQKQRPLLEREKFAGCLFELAANPSLGPSGLHLMPDVDSISEIGWQGAVDSKKTDICMRTFKGNIYIGRGFSSIYIYI